MKTFLEETKILTASDASAAATTTVNGTIVIDTLGYDEATFIAALGDVTVNSVLNLKVQGNTGNTTVGMTDITGATTGNITAGATDHDLKEMAVSVIKPTKRYLCIVFARGTANAVLNGVICILSKPRKAGPLPSAGLGDLVNGVSVTG